MNASDAHRGVLDNLLDGVLVVGAGGRIETLNPAAEAILGLDAEEAAGRGFAELFIAREGFDDFSQRILDATLPGGEPGRQVVEVEGENGARSLSVATSYLRAEGDGGGSGPVSVIAVFSDITEVRELRETELRMAKAAEEQHGKLQSAYREIEERNEALAAALRKVRVVQGFGFLLVVGVFLGAGLWTWSPAIPSFVDMAFLEGLWGEAGAAQAPDGEGAQMRTIQVKPRRSSSSITLKGRLQPWRETDVKTPVEGAIAAVHVRMGDTVEEGQTLLELDLSKHERKYQSRRLAFVKAEEKLAELKNWDKSPQMIKARRSFAKAQMSMDGRRGKMRKSRFLFEQGLMAAAEFEEEERQFKSQLLDFESAREELEAERAKADGKALAAAELSLEKARAEMLTAGELLDEGAIRAPFAGRVLPPTRSGKDLVEGVRLRKGDALFRIGDFSRIAASTTADEIDVIKLRAGQKVTVTGNAFPGVRLKGVVDRVSAEADPKQKRKAVFDVSVLLDKLTADRQARVRPGMSAKLKIVTYDNPKALMVPLDSVRRRGGEHWIRVLDEASGEAQDRKVTIGPTTRRRVEIASGLKAGETVVLPGG